MNTLNLRFGCALLGAAAASSAFTAAAIALAAPRSAATAKRAQAAPRPRTETAKTELASVTVHPALVHLAKKEVVAPKARPRLRRKPAVHQPTGVRIGATPSLYEHTTGVRALYAQGCAAGRVGTNGLVVLDFGKLEFRSRRGYGTITFGDRFASNTAITWAMKSYARGYSHCLSKSSAAHITLARGTSNYDQSVPSTYNAGRLWAGATVALGNYLKKHHLDHITAAAADDVEPAWDRGFGRTYDFFRGYHHASRGYLIYDFGSLDGGVGAIWTLRQVYYITGGMPDARAVPEIYNRSMAAEWAEAATRSVHRYGRPIHLAGLMTQHWTSCSGCGFTAPAARHALRTELAARSARVPERVLYAATNIGAATAG